MYKEDYDMDYYEDKLACAYADLYQGCGTMPLAALEGLCRRINKYRSKIYSFNKYGKRKEE